MSVEITQADIDVLRTLEPRKSILNFSSAELAATEKWTEKFQSELSEKSPFYRLINGDWRENDETRVAIISFSNKKISFSEIKEDVKNYLIERGIFANSDTAWNIQVSRKGIEDTIRYAFKHNDNVSYNMLYNIKEIIENGVLLDSVISEKNNPNKAHDTIFMHKMYCVCNIDNNPHIAKITIEEFASVNGETIKRLYNLQDLKIEPLRIIGLTENQLRPSVLNGSDISISDLFKLVKSFDKDFYLNKRSEQQIEKIPGGDERNDNMAETTQQELLERIAALEKQVSAMTAEQQNLKEQINTVNQFISSITESQNFEQSMATIESMGKQVLDCGKAEFWCYDGVEDKYFTNDENRGGRDWQIAKENMRIAADTKEAYIADGEAYIPIISNDKVAGILVASEKDGTFDKASIEKFAPDGQISKTIDLSLKKEFEHQGRITDELTGLKNRQGAKEYAINTMAHNINAGEDCCIVMCDADYFKRVNDTYGHEAGDVVLKDKGKMLKDAARQGNGTAVRWGGEEMILILNCGYDRAMDIMKQLVNEAANTTHLVYNAEGNPENITVTLSAGVYQVKCDKEITPENAYSFLEEQVKYADALVYEAKETGRNKVVGEYDIMQEKAAEKGNYSIFLIDNGVEKKYFRDDNTDVNALMQRIADGNLTYPEISRNCTEISEVRFAELEQDENISPAFCAEINLSTKDIIGDEKPMDITVWDNEKTATVSLDEAIQSLKENGTVNLDYQIFAENNDTVELASEYLDAAQHLNDVYFDFRYHNSIFNDEYIKFIDEHKDLPDNLDSPENRAVVSKFINAQLDGGNITEAQRESLKNLQQEIRNFEEPLFAQKVEEIAEWAEEVIDKFNDRGEPDRDDFER